MKSSLTFLLVLFSLIIILNTSLSEYIDQRTEQFAGSSTYVSSNANLLFDISDLESFLLSPHNITATDSTLIYFTDFSDVIMLEGRYPDDSLEFVSEEASEDIYNVGIFQADLNMLNYDKIYRYSNQKNLAVLRIDFWSDIDDQEVYFLNNKGFVEVNDSNIEKVIGLETYRLTSLILNTFLIVLMIIACIFFIASTQEYYAKYVKKFEVFQSLGVSSVEAGIVFLKFHIGKILFSWVISLFFTCMLLLGKYFIFKGVLPFFMIEDLIFLLLLFLGSLLYYFVTATLYYIRVAHTRGRKSSSVRLFAGILFYGAIILLMFLVDIKITYIFAIFIILVTIKLPKQFLTKVIFSMQNMYVGTIIMITSLVLVITAVLVYIPIDFIEKQERAINSIIISESVFRIDHEAVDPALLQQFEGDQYYYINPINGIDHEGDSVFPLIKSTKLSYFNDYNIEGPSISSSSVLIGKGLSKDKGIDIDDVIQLNNMSVQVTNIVESEEYAGQVVYLSNDIFYEIYGELGTSYYISEMTKDELESAGLVLGFYMDKAEYTKYYNNSAKKILLIPAITFVILLLISFFVIFQIFKILILNSQRSINIIRSLGMKKKDYCISIYIFLLELHMVAILVALLFYTLYIFDFEEWILKVSGSLVEFQLDGTVLLSWLLLLGLLQIIVVPMTYKKMTHISIYDQYKLTEVENM